MAAVVCAGLLFAQTFGAPVSEPDDLGDAESPPVSDPLIGYNRTMFALNDGIYRIAVRPASAEYEKVVPRPVRRGLENFFYNIRFPVRLAGSLLQAKIGRAARETGRFLVNSILGLGGFIRVSDKIPVLAPEPIEDVGQAFGFWGIDPGPYLVLPLLGPSDIRDLFGRVGEYFLKPTEWEFDHYHDWRIRLTVQSLDVVQSTPELLREYDAFRVNAIDPYLGVRNAYLAHRAAEIRR